MTVSVAPGVPMGVIQFSLRGTTSTGKTCIAPVSLNVTGIDLVGEVPEAEEDDLPGTIVLCNVDDDDQSGIRDGFDADSLTMNDGGQVLDRLDMNILQLRAFPTLAPGWTVQLTLVNETNVAPGKAAKDVVRIFADSVGPPVPILGPEAASFTLPENAASHSADLATLRVSDVVFWVEGLEFAGEIKLRADLIDNLGAATCTDQLQLKVSPLILMGHDRPAVRSFVSKIAGTESAEYCNVRFPNATPAGVFDEVIDIPNSDDPWAQDQFQIGFQSARYGLTYIVLDSKRPGGLANYPETLLGPDYGYLQIIEASSTFNDLDSFGNLEVSPPCVVGTTTFPFGRIYYGDGGTEPAARHMDPELAAFFTRQRVQSPVTFYTDWLLVGHVDEFMTFIPNPAATHGWSVMIASPSTAVDILAGVALVSGGVDPDFFLPKYGVDYQIYHVSNLLNAPLKDNAPTANSIQSYNEEMGTLDLQIFDLVNHVGTAFGLTLTSPSPDIIYVPVLFDSQKIQTANPNLEHKAIALTPNIVNGAVYGTQFLAPEPFLAVIDPAVAEEDTNGNFKRDPTEPDLNGNGRFDSHRDPFKQWVATFIPPGITVNYIDDWLIYHIGLGEVHCSSNDERQLPINNNWWDVP